jgi:ribosome biogenesis GTPase
MAQRTWTRKKRDKRQREDIERHEERRERRRASLMEQSVSQLGLEEAEEFSDTAIARSRKVKDGQRSQGEDLVPGRVIQFRRSLFEVQLEDGSLIQARSRSTTRSPHPDSTLVAVGDRVLVDPAQELIAEVQPRENRISRASKIHDEIEQVIVANVDQLLVVASVCDPYLKPGVLDRYLLAAEAYHISSIIVLNKVDLDPAGEWQEIAKIYRAAGYPVLECSAESRAGLDMLRDTLTDRVSVLSGQSGVGKSSLLNALDPELELPVGEIMQGARKGRHTTTHSRLIAFRFGGWVADTPGIKEFRLWGMDEAEVAALYPEFRVHAGECHFHNCSHTHEPDCAVKQAVEDGIVSMLRYRNYLQVLEQLRGN